MAAPSRELYPNKELFTSPGRREEGEKGSRGIYVRKRIYDRSLTTSTANPFALKIKQSEELRITQPQNEHQRNLDRKLIDVTHMFLTLLPPRPPLLRDVRLKYNSAIR